jgi:Raf kinase inhibitor-like YbhB/YbcL family protein
MKRLYLLIAILGCTVPAFAQTFTLKSRELGGQATNKQVLNGFGCSGENHSPQFFWEHPPQNTKSFALTIFDESAPTGSGWWHWLIFDMSRNVTGLKSGAGNTASKLAPPGAIQSVNDFKTFGYGGPCPPEGGGIHKYVVTLYALKSEKLGIDSTSNPALVGFLLNQNVIEKATLVFYYKR